jgi:hypothetical protein
MSLTNVIFGYNRAELIDRLGKDLTPLRMSSLNKSVLEPSSVLDLMEVHEKDCYRYMKKVYGRRHVKRI